MIVSEFLQLLKAKMLTEKEKDYIFEVVKNIEKRTELQKTRFFMYYGLGPYINNNITMPKIAK